MHTAIGMKALWWMPSLLHCPIFSYSFQWVKCRSAATLVILELFAGCASEHQKRRARGRRKKRRERKGRRTGHTGERLEPAQGWDAGLVSKHRQQRSLRLKAGGRRWRAGGNHQRLTAVLINKRHTPKAVFFLSEQEINPPHPACTYISRLAQTSSNCQLYFVNLHVLFILIFFFSIA